MTVQRAPYSTTVVLLPYDIAHLIWPHTLCGVDFASVEYYPHFASVDPRFTPRSSDPPMCRFLCHLQGLTSVCVQVPRSRAYHTTSESFHRLYLSYSHSIPSPPAI